MDIEKILEMLGVEKLDESKQTEIQDTLATIIEAKAKEIATDKVEENLVIEKEKLVEEYETKFEDYKEDVTSKFSNFVDSILEEEMVIPEKIVRYARLGELYEDLIDQFKVRLAIDEGLLNDEVKGMLKEAKEEIETLRSDVNELTGTKLQLEEDAKKMATHIYLRKKCDGLTETQKSTVLNILEGSSQEEIDSKFDVIVESISTKTEEKVDESTEEKINEEETKTSTTVVDEETKQTMNESNGSMMDYWKKMIRENKFS
jgi:hypothetical protein